MATRTEAKSAATSGRPQTPHLSHSRVNRYLLCPEQYRLYYVEGLRPRRPSASLVFGQVVHQALAHLFQAEGDPVRHFLESWEGARELDLTYPKRDSWEKLRDTGKGLLEKFVAEELPTLEDVEAAEKPFELDVGSLDVPFVGVIDLIARREGKRTVVDFKTSASSYKEHQVVLSDQLSAYTLAEPEAEAVALCVLVKTREPRIEWHPATRSGHQLLEYLGKTEHVAREIAAGRFYKWPGLWCSWCDYLPVCLDDSEKAGETLITIS